MHSHPERIQLFLLRTCATLSRIPLPKRSIHRFFFLIITDFVLTPLILFPLNLMKYLINIKMSSPRIKKDIFSWNWIHNIKNIVQPLNRTPVAQQQQKTFPFFFTIINFPDEMKAVWLLLLLLLFNQWCQHLFILFALPINC